MYGQKILNKEFSWKWSNLRSLYSEGKLDYIYFLEENLTSNIQATEKKIDWFF